MIKTVKIFVDAHSFDKEQQGTQTFIRGLYNALLQRYPALDIYMGAYDTNRVAAAFPALHPSRILAYRNKGFRRMIFDIPALLNHHSFDFAHFQYIIPRAVKNCRYIVTLHDILYKEMPQYFPMLYIKLRSLLFKRSFLSAGLKTTVSQYSRNSISKYYDVPLSAIFVIPNAVDAMFAKNLSRENARRRIADRYGLSDFILYVGRIEPRKNHALLLKSYLKLNLYQRGIALVFIGNNSIPDRDLSAMMKSIGEPEKKSIHFFQDIPEDDLKAFYSACSLFVYPSKGEGFGIPPLEAAVCSAPVLCSGITAMQDFNFFKPYLFDPADEVDFNKKMLDMINNPVSPDFIMYVKKAVEERYSWEKSAEIFYNMLQPAAADKFQ